MATVFDAAVCILSKSGEMTAMKLQKLCYYAQAWSLAWDGRPLFDEAIEARANGPVCRELYDAHSGQFEVSAAMFNDKGDPSRLAPEQRETVDEVLKFYGDKSSQWLSELTRAEEPWKNARRGSNPGERGFAVISRADMAGYYGSL